MDCREFRKQHFAYLDDTLPGDVMSLAQQHIMKCDPCAAHDTMVRRSLMLVRNVKVLEPSAEFRRKMQARLDEARCEKQQEKLRIVERASSPAVRVSSFQPVMLSVFAASVLVVGTIVWRDRTPAPEQIVSMQTSPPMPSFQPVINNPLDSVVQPEITVTPAMVHAMATGNPMWPATFMVDEAPAQFMNADFTQVRATR